MSKFEISKDKAGEFRFNLKSGNGEIILKSEGYKDKESCEKGIRAVRINALEDDHFDRKEASGGYRFNLKASNGEIVGSSEVYTTLAAMEKGITSVKANAPDAEIQESGSE
ncbi:YegP family protein [Salinimicrobium flavum]|uniref:YegP family protein n=1 Tax=Salinimicrobium flavum TaxID=1737065 RepID=A0ABW5IWK6_9FLAO